MMTETAATRPIRTVFLGTPEYAVPCLRVLADDPQFDVRMVVTQPDRPAGRGKQLKAPPVKVAAEELGLTVYQPSTLRDPESRMLLEEAAADIFVVAAFGLIFGKKSLAIPRYGTINLHASLLPKYRGAAPVNAAILNGDKETGVSLMLIEPGLDTGPVIGVTRMPIESDDTTESLTAKLASAGAILAIDAIPKFVRGEVEAIPQPESGVTTVRQLEKRDGWIDWTLSAAEIERQVRAMWPWPRAWTDFHGEPVQIHKADVGQSGENRLPGTIQIANGEVQVATMKGTLSLVTVQPAGGKPVAAVAWANGRRIATGDRFDVESINPPATPFIEAG